MSFLRRLSALSLRDRVKSLVIRKGLREGCTKRKLDEDILEKLHLLTGLEHLRIPKKELDEVAEGREVLNCSEIDGILAKFYLAPSYGLEFCIGFPGNLMRETSYYGCIINRYVLHVNLYSSILFMVWLSMDRYLLIRHPARNHFLLKPRAALVVTGLSWLAVNVEVIPMVALMLQDLQSGNWSRCNDFASLQGDVSALGYSMGLTLTGYILPLLGLCGFSHRIGRLLQTQEMAFHRRTAQYKRALRVMASASVMFLVLYTPYHVMRNIRIASRQAWAGVQLCTKMYIEGLYILTRPLAFFHSVINPVFYFLMGDKFRKFLLAKFRKLARKTT
ncbi:succinate receptor 1-like [Syngnathoides biaculeatus]|uniref:succinate receptor 1-like n=1 Tax=Syngnathoides biaculeatus TaxID=300417 RepID=UPI002ADDEC0D|nr:succinate receptor 1-like [Syngnathoides biaculeatus]